MICQNFKCKKNIPDGTKKCPECSWMQKDKTVGKQQSKPAIPTIALTVSVPQKQADGNFNVPTYAVARHSNGNLANDGQQIVFHLDDLVEFTESSGTREHGRADHVFTIPAQRGGENMTITVYTQTDNQRCEATKSILIPKKEEKPPKKIKTPKNFFTTLNKYKKGDKK